MCSTQRTTISFSRSCGVKSAQRSERRFPVDLFFKDEKGKLDSFELMDMEEYSASIVLQRGKQAGARRRLLGHGAAVNLRILLAEICAERPDTFKRTRAVAAWLRLTQRGASSSCPRSAPRPRRRLATLHAADYRLLVRC